MSFVNASPVPNPSGSVTPVAVPPSSWSRKVMAMSSAQSRLTLTALGIGVGLGGFFALLLMCIFIVFYRRRKFNKKKRVDELLCEHDYLDNYPQLRKENVSPLFDIVSDSSKRVVSPHVATKPQLPLVQASYVIPFSTSDGGSSEKPVSGESTSYSYRTFSYVELARATDNFSSVNLLGQGGFGYVHKGVLLDGTEVAVKQLKTGSGQGEREFQAEVDTISRVQLKHLVSLVGYCISDDQRLLVYEFVPNKTLEFHLHAVGEGRTPLSWSTRLKIALGSARGLTYLHEDCHPKIIHRDIKASNILLDDDFEAKVADFGLAKFSYDNDTHVSTRVMGTFGYLAPEYASSGKLTEKSDVFSFGVVLLELITGRRPIDKGHCFMDDSMVEWARPLLREALETGNFDGLVDPKLDQYNAAEMGLMVACAAASVQQSAKRRPRMSQIVQALEGNLSIDNLCNELSPASSGKWGGSSEYEQYKENMKKFRKLALESQDVSTCTGISATASISSNPTESQNTGSGNSKKDIDEDVHEIPIL